MSHKIAQTDDEATSMQERYEDKPHGWIQWKGTDVCIDIHCVCGAHLHLDVDFLYNVQCAHCKKYFQLNPHIELIELKEEPKGCLKIGYDSDIEAPPENANFFVESALKRGFVDGRDIK